MRDDELDEDSVGAELATAWLGRPYRYVARIDSTNDFLKGKIGDPAYPAGTVLLADYQSAGRGRLDRRWEAPPGTSLLFSVLLRPGWPARRGAWLTMLAGLAVAETIEAVVGLPAHLKWPNDVVIDADVLIGDGPWRKTCGLLLDVVLAPESRLESAIIGIGLNVNIPAESLPEAVTPATSLLVAAGRPIPRRPLLLALLERLERRYDEAAAALSPWAAWNERLITVGQMVRVTAAGGAEPIDGLAEGTDELGQLLLRDAGGQLHIIAAGDVTLRGR
jgi:BirA family biotin operon repressor/biotin-[acetyl-CoA-carboxylase] ligase